MGSGCEGWWRWVLDCWSTTGGVCATESLEDMLASNTAFKSVWHYCKVEAFGNSPPPLFHLQTNSIHLVSLLHHQQGSTLSQKVGWGTWLRFHLPNSLTGSNWNLMDIECAAAAGPIPGLHCQHDKNWNSSALLQTLAFLGSSSSVFNFTFYSNINIGSLQALRINPPEILNVDSTQFSHRH